MWWYWDGVCVFVFFSLFCSMVFCFVGWVLGFPFLCGFVSRLEFELFGWRHLYR